MISKWISLAFLLLVVANPTYADSRTDSLMQRLEQTANDSERVAVLHSLGNAFENENESIALKYYNNALEVAEKHRWKRTMAQQYVSIGRIMNAKFLNAKALENHNKAFKLFREAGDSMGMAVAMNNIGLANGNMGNITIQEQNYRTALQMFLALGEHYESILPRNNLGVLYMEAGKTDSALKLYTQNLDILDTLNKSFYSAATLNNIGRVWSKKKDYGRALKYFKESLEIKEKIKRPISARNTLNNIAEALIGLGRYQEAKAILDENLQFFRKRKAVEYIPEVYQILSLYYESRGDQEQALRNFKKFHELEDSLNSKEKQKEFENIWAGLELDRKETEIKILRQDQEISQANLALLEKDVQVADTKRSRQRWAMIAMAGFLIFAVALTLVLLRSNRRHRQAKKLLAQKNEEIHSQQEAIQKQNDQLAMQNLTLEKMAREKDAFMQTVAHDIKTPLNRVTGYAQLIAISGGLSEEQRSYIKAIEKVNRNAGKMISELLELNALEHGNRKVDLEHLDLKAMIQESLKGFMTEAQRKSITLHFPELNGPIQIQSDEKCLNRILDNLVSNALKFSPYGKNIYVSAIQENGHVDISVKDEGPGIKPEEQKKLFRRFQQLSARPTGGESSTGLGLAITQSLVQQLNGEILVQSEPGKGAEFIVRLPVVYSS